MNLSIGFRQKDLKHCTARSVYSRQDLNCFSVETRPLSFVFFYYQWKGYIAGATTLLWIPQKNRRINISPLNAKNGWLNNDCRNDPCNWNKELISCFHYKENVCPTKWKHSICISDFMQTTFFYLGGFLKKLADDHCFSITKGSIYHIKHVSIQPWIDLKLHVLYLQILRFFMAWQMCDTCYQNTIWHSWAPLPTEIWMKYLWGPSLKLAQFVNNKEVMVNPT